MTYDAYTHILFSLQALMRGLRNRKTLIPTQTCRLRRHCLRISMYAFLEAVETCLVKLLPLSETEGHSEKCLFSTVIIG